MKQEHTNSKIISSLLWKLIERSGTQGIQFVVQIILARLLLPETYGMIALISIFIQIANVFVQSGFNTALIQKKDADEVDFSSVFYLSLFIATILYFIIFISAPFIARFYNEPELIKVLRVLSLILFTGAFNSIQNAFVARNMLFKKLFFSSLGAVIVSGVLGVIVAYLGFGVWALVAQQISHQIVVTVILWFTVKWRPKLIFSFKKIKTLFSFGSKLLMSTLIDTLYRNLRTMIIGKIYTPATLGYYNRGEQFPQFIVSNIDGSIQSVMLPTLSAYQDDKNRVKEIMRRAIVSSSFIILPMMVGLAVVAEPLITIILTEKWLPAAPFLQVFCASYALMPIHTANLQAINALGRSDIFLKLEIIKKTIGIIVLVISIPYGVMAMAWGAFISGVIASFVNAFPNKKLLNYSYLEQIKDIFPSLLISLIMGVIVFSFNYLPIATVSIFILQIIFGIVVYIRLAKLFKIDSLDYLKDNIKNTVSKKNN